jgi:hypothetical protein
VGALFGRSRPETADARPLEDLLEEMHDLRLTLAVDLTAAAGAADAGANEVARDIIEADRQELARFARVANINLERLTNVAVRREPSPWRRRVATALPVVPVVTAMALSAAAATGALHLPGTGQSHAPRAAAIQNADAAPLTTFNQLVKVLDSDPSASQVIAAASKLHKQLSQLLAISTDNPSQAQEVARLLRMEQNLLLRTQPPGASIVLDASRKLEARLVTVVPSASPSISVTLPPTPQPSAHRDQHHAVSSAAPKPTVTPSPKSTPSSSPSPSANSKPDSSPSPSNSQFPNFPR